MKTLMLLDAVVCAGRDNRMGPYYFEKDGSHFVYCRKIRLLLLRYLVYDVLKIPSRHNGRLCMYVRACQLDFAINLCN